MGMEGWNQTVLNQIPGSAHIASLFLKRVDSGATKVYCCETKQSNEKPFHFGIESDQMLTYCYLVS